MQSRRHLIEWDLTGVEQAEHGADPVDKQVRITLGPSPFKIAAKLALVGEKTYFERTPGAASPGFFAWRAHDARFRRAWALFKLRDSM
jgi:hypothetical protein